MCVNRSNTQQAEVSWSLFLFPGIFVPAASHIVLSYTLARRIYNVVVQLYLTFTYDISYLYLSTFVHRFLFLNKLVRESERVQEGYMD
ncbi:hypothetical protein BHE74_00021246 [Ensete ventricosum]|nr:hypothetical protein BHE74_00021246 [Ensete ventricosum]RZR90776.1 hypothetical protein BHM03_00018741 [Ensete ventricosum]